MEYISNAFGWPLGLLAFLLYMIFPNYGVVLIVFTILTRVLLLPFAIKQQRSTAKMASFQPKLQELQKKYGNDKQRYQQETLKLYQEEKYNPMGGCLPLLIQFPILMGIINVVYNPLTHFLRIGKDELLQATDVAKTILESNFNVSRVQLEIINLVQSHRSEFQFLGDDIINKIVLLNERMNFLGLDLKQSPKLEFSPLIIIPILSAILSFFSIHLTTKLNSSVQTAQVNGMNTGMKLIMPLFSCWLSFSYPLGVGLYWAVGYIVSIGQTFFMKKFYNPQKMAEEIRKKSEEENKRKTIIKEIVIDEDGTEKVNEEILSQKDLNRKRIAEARRREAEKYGDEYREED